MLKKLLTMLFVIGSNSSYANSFSVDVDFANIEIECKKNIASDQNVYIVDVYKEFIHSSLIYDHNFR